MNKTNHIYKVLLLIAIYCFGLSASAQTLQFSQVQIVQNLDGKAELFVKSTKDHLLHTQPTENIITALELQIAPDYDVALDDFASLQSAFELKYLSTYRQYTSHLKNIRIKFRKSDLIFPFHYFW